MSNGQSWQTTFLRKTTPDDDDDADDDGDDDDDDDDDDYDDDHDHDHDNDDHDDHDDEHPPTGTWLSIRRYRDHQSFSKSVKSLFVNPFLLLVASDCRHFQEVL